MDNAKPARPDHQRRLRAAEIALGLVDASQHEEALRLDPALREDVARWSRDLACLADELAPVAPAPETWSALKARIETDHAARAGTLSSMRRRMTPTRRLGLWRGLAAGGFAATAALAFILMSRSPEPPPRPVPPTMQAQIVLVSSLLPKDGPPIFIASFEARAATIIAVPANADAVQGGVPHLWLVPKDDRDPIALGSLAVSRPTRLLLPPDVAAQADREASLVVTLEPSTVPDGDRARGPVIAHGVFVEP